jgi:dTDP-L-rhamnose 4-epimerase
MHAGRAGACYNLGGGVTATVNEVLHLLERATGKRARIRYSGRQAGDAAHTSADTTAARRELGFSPVVPLAEGLKREVEWLAALPVASQSGGAPPSPAQVPTAGVV